MTRHLAALLLVLVLISGASAADDHDCRIEFNGILQTDEDDLRSAAAADLSRTCQLIRGKEDPELILVHAEDAAFEMSLFLVGQGYTFSRVEPVLLPLTKEDEPALPPEAIRFDVTEGPIVLLGGASVSGVDEETAAELVRFVKAPRTSLLGSEIYVESVLSGASQRMRSWLRQRGHRDAEVQLLPVPEIENRNPQPAPAAPTDEPGTGPKAGKVTVRIEYEALPGPIHLLADVRIDGCNVFDPAKLAANEAIQAYVGLPYEPFTPFDLEATIKDYYGRRGYPFVDVTANEAFEPDGDLVNVNVTLLVREGPLVRVGGIRIEGNLRTQDSVVRRELTVGPGDTVNIRKLEASQRRVLKTGLFKQAFIDLERPDRPGLLDETDPIDADLVLRIEENDFQRFETAVGFGSWEFLRGSIGYSWVNVVGTGRTLGVKVAGSFRGWRASATATEPWLFPDVLWDHTVGAAELSIEQQERPTFTSFRQAIGASVTKEELFHKLDASLTYVFRITDVTNVTGDVPEDFEDTTNIGSLTFGIVRDARDNPWSPTTGSLISASLEAANRAFGGDIDFFRLRVGVTQVFDLGANVRFVSRVAVGAISPSGGESEVPLQERFFLGGGQTVRSFRQDDLGPRFEDNGGESDSAAGGEFYSQLNLELRVPVWGDLEGAAFLDMGNIIENVRDASLRDYRYGIGAGLRFSTPLGAVRLDFAVNPNPRDYEDSWAIFFAVGYPF